MALLRLPVRGAKDGGPGEAEVLRMVRLALDGRDEVTRPDARASNVARLMAWEAPASSA